MVGYRTRPPPGKPGGCSIRVVHWLLVLPIGLWITMLMGSLAGFVALGVERGERVVFDARLLSLIVRESVARSLFWLLLPLGMVSSAPVGVPVVGEPGVGYHLGDTALVDGLQLSTSEVQALILVTRKALAIADPHTARKLCDIQRKVDAALPAALREAMLAS